MAIINCYRLSVLFTQYDFKGLEFYLLHFSYIDVE